MKCFGKKNPAEKRGKMGIRRITTKVGKRIKSKELKKKKTTRFSVNWFFESRTI